MEYWPRPGHEFTIPSFHNFHDYDLQSPDNSLLYTHTHAYNHTIVYTHTHTYTQSYTCFLNVNMEGDAAGWWQMASFKYITC